jgi:hypothetical protein
MNSPEEAHNEYSIDQSERIVCKFGGTSLADAVQIRKVAAIVQSDPRRRFVVVSAPGKRNSSDQKITDLLLTCWHLAAQKLDYREPLRLIRERYEQIARDLNVRRSAAPLSRCKTNCRAWQRVTTALWPRATGWRRAASIFTPALSPISSARPLCRRANASASTRKDNSTRFLTPTSRRA